MSEYIVRMPPDMPYEIRAELNAWYVESEPIVRCRDCKYYETVPEDSGDWCGYWTDRIYADTRGSGFCHRGERREP